MSIRTNTASQAKTGTHKDTVIEQAKWRGFLTRVPDKHKKVRPRKSPKNIFKSEMAANESTKFMQEAL